MKSDVLLLAAARKMDQDALTAIFDLYASAIYKYAFRLSNNAAIADQIVGDVFAKLIEQLSAGNGPRVNLRSYLFEMAYHIFVDEVRCLHRSAPMEAAGFTYSNGSFTDVSAENRILFETVLRAIVNDLTDDQRHVVILRFMEGFSLKETAAIVGKTVVNVKVIQNRAVAALRKAIDYQVVETHSITIMIQSISHA